MATSSPASPTSYFFFSAINMTIQIAPSPISGCVPCAMPMPIVVGMVIADQLLAVERVELGDRGDHAADARVHVAERVELVARGGHSVLARLAGRERRRRVAARSLVSFARRS